VGKLDMFLMVRKEEILSNVKKENGVANGLFLSIP
jgi:hypothetical protein